MSGPTDLPDDDLMADAESRRRALGLDSFIVEAPAGAGKTELLTQRFLRLLATVDEPEEVVALTFTNKAAGEMRARIVDSLALARSGERPAEPHRQITFDLAVEALGHGARRDWCLAERSERLRISTLDALCAGLARQLPLMSRFGTQPAVIEDARRHYREAARRTVDQLEDGEQGAAVADVLDHLDNDQLRLVELLGAMLARREQWLGIANPEMAVGEALADLVADELATLAEALDESWQRTLMPCACYSAANGGVADLHGWQQPLAPAMVEIVRWRALADLLLTRDGFPRKAVDRRLGFPAGDAGKSMKADLLRICGELGDDRLEALRAIRRLPAATPGAGADELLQALATLLRLAAAQLWLVFREQGEVDFTELAMRATVALGDEGTPSELALRLDYGIRHLLVDEFQDTSPAQVSLLTRLTAGWQPGDGRTLFAVGDPMQSIYRFRKADVGLFLRVAESGIGDLRLNRLRLMRNNRSAPVVVGWVNDTFAGCFPATDAPLRGQVAYRRCVAGRETDESAMVALHPVVAGAAGQDVAEAEVVADLVGAERATDPERGIAILVRARSHLTAIMAALAKQGMRPTAVDIEPLAGRQVVQDLLSLTRALLHRADRVNWLALLRAPWCGLRLEDMHALAGDDLEATVWSLINDEPRQSRLTPDGAHRLACLRRVLAEALGGAGGQSMARRAEDAWRKLGGEALLGDDGEAAAAAAFFRRLEAVERGGRLTWDGLDEEFNELFAPPAPDADPRLQLMTIHKAKGLEFDTVILPGLHRATRDSEYPLLAWDTFPFEGGERLVAAPVNARRPRDGMPTAYDYLCERERERDRNESLRVLYVAATRARRRLHLVAAVERNADGNWRPPAARSPLSYLVPMLEMSLAGLAPEPGHADSLHEVPAEFAPRLRRAVALPDMAGWWAPATGDQPVEATETVDPEAAMLGRLAHACLEQMAAGGQPWDAEALPARMPLLANWLGLRGWSSAQSRAGAKRVAGWLATTLRSPAGQWVLRPRAAAASELALSKVGAGAAAGEESVVTRVLDRSFVEDGVRWIIDYKTVDLGQADDSTFAANAERYRRQLEGYAALFAGDGLPVRIAVLYLAHGRLVEL